ncbi:MAG: hypothetical protein ACOC5B_01810 [Myxococcota bacterium]
MPRASDPLTSRDAFRSWPWSFFARYDHRFLTKPTEFRAFEGYGGWGEAT